MKIGVDACCWGNKRGFGRFTRELLEALLEIDDRNEYLFFLDNSVEESEIPARVGKIKVETSQAAIEAASAEGRRSLADLWAMSRAVLNHRVDVFFFPAVYSYYPIFNRTKTVVTIHDMIADRNPELIFPNTKSKIFWKLKQNTAVFQADLILTVSEYSKMRIAEHFNLPEKRLRVINEAARPVFRVLAEKENSARILRRFGLEKDTRFLLYVGGISPHKNLQTLISAFEIIGREDAELKLILAGDYEKDSFFSALKDIKKRIESLGITEKVIFTGFLNDEELVAFYNHTALLVFPSFEEGFGLPAIEAMACGTPVAASNCGSLPEVLAEAGEFFDPFSVESAVSAIRKVLSDDNLRRSMSAQGLARASQSTWKKAAQDTLKIFSELHAPKHAEEIFRARESSENV